MADMKEESIPQKCIQRLLVQKSNVGIAIKIEDIACIYRDKLYLVVVDNLDRRFLYNSSLDILEKSLDKEMFFRANRKVLININYIQSYKILDRVKLEVKLTLDSINFQIIVSQLNTSNFKKWLQGD